jgi:hypothetical protein
MVADSGDNQGGTMRPRVATLLLTGALALAAPAAFADAIPSTVLYSVKIAGSQTVQWHFNGDVRVGGCGDGTPDLQTGAGSG